MSPLKFQRPKLSASLFTPEATQTLQFAQNAARHWGHSYVGCEHLLFGLLQGSNAAVSCLRTEGFSSALVQDIICAKMGRGTPGLFPSPELTARLRGVIRQGAVEMVRYHHSQVDCTHLLLGLLRETEGLAASIINREQSSAQHLSEAVIAALNGGDNNAGQTGRSRTERETYTSESKLLELFSRDMVQAAMRGRYDPVIGRDKEIMRTMQILIRRSKNNPVLLGDPGVGKTAVAEGLALRMAAGQVPEALKGKRLLSLDLSAMVAGTKYRGEFEERVNNLLRDVRRVGNIILFLDEMHTIIGAGSAEGAIDAANILKPALARGDIQMIGATTREEYRKIEKDAALERRFQPVTIDEPTCETALQILQRLRPRYEAHHQVTITPEAMEAAVTMSHRYLPSRRLPDKAIDLIDEAASSLRLVPLTLPVELRTLETKVMQTAQDKEASIRRQDFERAAMLRNAELDFRRELEDQRHRWHTETGFYSVTRETIANVVSQWTGIPASSLTQEERRHLLSLEEILHRRVAGQDEAIKAVAEAIRRGRTGMTDPRRPTGTFLFLGPTGVGKTELCKALAEALFGTEDALLRFDMTEYAEAHAVSRLLGSPPGYVGFDEGGQLTEQVRRRPYSVILFDELEKAHSDIWSILLQMMEDGILTDAKGNRVDFRNTVLVMTSNAAADQLNRKGIGFAGAGAPSSKQSSSSASRTAALAELRKTFRMEFLNRLDEIIVFRSLDEEELQAIAKKLLLQLTERMRGMGIAFTFTPESLQFISKEAFDPLYGARPLRRLLQTQVETPAAHMLLEGRLSAGNTLYLTVQNNLLTLQTLMPAV